MTFQENLRRYREKAGLTAKEFAAMIGEKYTTYAGYETQGREPKYEKLCKIAAALHVTTDELLGYELNKYQGMYNYLKNIGALVEKREDSILVGFPLPMDRRGSTGEKYWLYQTEEGLYNAVQKAKRAINEDTKAICKRFLMEQFTIDGQNEIKKIHPEAAKAIDLIFNERSTNHE